GSADHSTALNLHSQTVRLSSAPNCHASGLSFGSDPFTTGWHIMMCHAGQSRDMGLCEWKWRCKCAAFEAGYISLSGSCPVSLRDGSPLPPITTIFMLVLLVCRPESGRSFMMKPIRPC